MCIPLPSLLSMYLGDEKQCILTQAMREAQLALALLVEPEPKLTLVAAHQAAAVALLGVLQDKPTEIIQTLTLTPLR